MLLHDGAPPIPLLLSHPRINGGCRRVLCSLRASSVHDRITARAIESTALQIRGFE
jgi:hypothetical protein